jgi:Flp pilus assembly protein protease CpaA
MEGSEKMLQFLSFVVTLALLGGLLTFIVVTIRNASESVLKALGGQSATHHDSVTFVTFDRRTVRKSMAPRAAFAPLRAAA